MSNVTISLDEDLLKAGREYSKTHRVSLNALIRELLTKTVIKPKKNKAWIEEYFRLVKQAKIKPKNWKWNRDEIYDL